MQILPYCPIRDKHSFHMDVTARYWAEYDNVSELQAILKDAAEFGMPIVPVGGGCNILFREEAYQGILLHSKIQGITILEENEQGVLIKVGAGMKWDDLVQYCVEKGWGGMENLSGIPGDVGATPVQNIGAYGVEAASVIRKVEVLNRETLQTEVWEVADCRLGYRSSCFKTDQKDRYIVTYVHYQLGKNPEYRLSYGLLKEKVEALGGLDTQPEAVRNNLRKIRQAVLAIRNSKLPQPEQLGNAGSFFVNPEVDADYYGKYHALYPDMPAWSLPNGRWKLSAAWMIEQCGWKGKRAGDAGVYDKQAMVLVNYGKATGKDLIRLFEQITADVCLRFELKLSPEVVLLSCKDEI